LQIASPNPTPVSGANKVKVLFDWGKAALFGRDASRF
jgi:hypothetical protein